jgi:hypothetical protein
MDQLVLSESAIVELNGKEVTIPKNAIIKIDRNESLFIIDEDVEILIDNKRILLEAGDAVEIRKDGKYILSNNCEIISSGRKFILETGDLINIHEGIGWDNFKAGMANQKLLGQLGRVQSSLRRIVNKAKKIYQLQQDRNIKNDKLKKIFDSAEWDMFNEIATAASSDEIEDIMDAIGADIADTMASLEVAFKDAGQINIARMINTAIPRSFLGKLANMFGNGSEKASNLTERPKKVATIEDGSEFQIGTDGNKAIAIPMGRDDLVYGAHHDVIKLSNGKQGIKIDGKEYPFVSVKVRKLNEAEANIVKSASDVKESEATEPETLKKKASFLQQGQEQLKIAWNLIKDAAENEDASVLPKIISGIAEKVGVTPDKLKIWGRKNDPEGYAKALEQQKQSKDQKSKAKKFSKAT